MSTPPLSDQSPVGVRQQQRHRADLTRAAAVAPGDAAVRDPAGEGGEVEPALRGRIAEPQRETVDGQVAVAEAAVRPKTRRR